MKTSFGIKFTGIISLLFCLGIASSFGAVKYVKSDASGANNGASWDDAFYNLQTALAAASSGDEIWVAKGTYLPTSGTDTLISFQMKSQVNMYGGFIGNETNLSQRDCWTSETILSGSISGGKSKNVVIGASNSIIDGFIISDAGTFGSGSGGGILAKSSQTIINCTFRNNSALLGAGICFSANSTSISLKNCLFYSNSADHGSAIYNDVGASAIVENCTVYGNSDIYGSCVFAAGSAMQVKNSIVWGNNINPQISCNNISYCNVNTDPLFANTASRNFHLKSQGGRWDGLKWVYDAQTSPCIDAGDPASSYSNETSPNGGRINMGVYGNTIYASRTYVPVTVTFAAGDNGTLTGTTSQTVPQGGSCSAVTAVSNSGYHFVNWSGDYTGIDNPLTVTNVTGNLTVTANFAVGETLTSGLVAYYPFNGNANDASGRGHNGTVSAATLTTDRFGLANKAYSFNGINNYISIPHHSDFNMGNNYSISVWIQAQNNAQYRTIIMKNSTGFAYGAYMYLLAWPDTTDHLQSCLGADSSLYQWLGEGEEAPIDNNWHHVVLVVSDQYQLWVDGNLKISTARIISPAENTAPIQLGLWGAEYWPFYGKIDDVRIYNRALSATDVGLLSEITHTLSYTAGTNGSILGTSPQTVNHAASGTEIVAVPAPNYHFVNWSDSSTANPRTDTNVTADITVTANFAIGTTVRYVKYDAAGANNGTSWANAYTDFQNAINNSTYGDQLWVAAGTYKPTSWPNGGAGERYKHFSMKKGVKLYGGFLGDETSIAQRNYKKNATILSGDIGLPGDNTDNCYHVFYHPDGLGLDINSAIDGFTVTAGYGDIANSDNLGAGIFNDNQKLNILNCNFRGNSNVGSNITGDYFHRGTAIYNNNSDVVIEYCDFKNNTISTNLQDHPHGGAIYHQRGSLNIDFCNFESNSIEDSSEFGSDSLGGAIFVTVADTNINGCLFKNNFVKNNAASLLTDPLGGGAIFISGTVDTANPYNITNSTFCGNSAIGDKACGGALYSTQNTTINSCTFNGNSAEYAGGGIYNDFRTIVLKNVLLWGNGGAGKEIEGFAGTLSYCVVEGGYTGGTNIITVTPQLQALANNGGPIMTCAIGADSSALAIPMSAGGNWNGSPDSDQRGFSRPASGLRAIGAFDPNVTLPIYTLRYIAGSNGSISGVNPQSVICLANGSEVHATPNAGYHFVSWDDGILTASRTDTKVTGDLTITASFALTPYTLTVNSGTGDGIYTMGAVVGITADSPASGKVFNAWIGDTRSVSNVNASSTNVTMPPNDVAVTASYKNIGEASYLLTVNSGSGDGSYAAGTVVNIYADAPPSGKEFNAWIGDTANVANVNSASTSITMPSSAVAITASYKDVGATSYLLTVNSGSGDGSYAANTIVNIVADAPTIDKLFDKWTGNVTNVTNVNSASTTITMPVSAATVTANYKFKTYTLAYSAGAGGSISGTTPQTVNYGANGATVTAVPNTGYHFVQWSDSVMTASRAETNVIANVAVSASFAINTYTVTFDLAGKGTRTGGGALSQTINHGSGATAPTVSPNAGWVFSGWDKTFSNITANTTVTAQYAVATYTVTFDLAGKGTRTGGGALSQTINHGSGATAPTVSPNVGWVFSGWDKAFSNITGITTVTAQYSVATYTVTFDLAGKGTRTGGGALSQTINHGSGATAPTVSPNVGWVFSGWDKAFINVAGNTTVTALYTVATYTVTFVEGANGTITGTKIQTVNHGAACTAVTAAGNTGYHFVNWTGDYSGTTNPLTVSNVTANKTITANFAINSYTLTYNAGPNGSITGTTPQTVTHGASGTQVTAVPNANYHFVKWSDDVMTASITDTNVTGDKTVTANFAINTFALTVNSGSGDGVYAYGSVNVISADAPPAGKEFNAWTGDTRSVANVNASSTNVTMPANDVTVTATYKFTGTTSYVLTVNSGSGDGSYSAGTVVNIYADAPPSGKEFNAWIGNTANVANVNSTSTTITMPSSATAITASYKDIGATSYELTVNNGSGDGTYAASTIVNIVANAPDSGKQFNAWIGDTRSVSSVNSTSTNVTMPANDVLVTAAYKDIGSASYTLTVNNGSGDGSYAAGTLVNIYADAPPSGKEFNAWIGDTANVANVNSANTTITIPSLVTTITASYKDIGATSYALTVNSGSGDGAYAAGTVVSIVADATTIDKIFAKWIGDVSNVLDVNSSSTTISMPASATAVTATYKTRTYTITASFGTNGSITPAGLTSVDYGSSQAFSITPAADYHVANVLVDGISVGAVSGYTFTNVTADHSISATFSANISSYVVTFVEGANGTITGSKVQTVINGDNCSTVTAHANPHYHFVNWTGALASTNNPLTVMNVGSDMTITANFAIDTYTLDYGAAANGSIIGTNPQTVPYGADGATVTAMPNIGYHFVKWSDDVMTASRRDENVTGGISVIATFAEAETTAVLTMAVNGRGTVIPVPGAYTVDREGVTAITATAAPGNSFVNWAVSGNAVVADVNAADTTVTMSGDSGIVTANFTSGTLTTLENGMPVFDIRGDAEDIRIFKITLPPGQTLLQAQTTAGDFGDCDMYIRHGAVPTLSIYDEKSTNEGNAELIEINDPASGDWYVMLHAQKAYSGVTLTVRYSTDAPAKVLSLNATQGLFKDRIRLTWAAVSGATDYEIWRSDVNDVGLSEKIRTVSAFSVPPYDDMLGAKNSYKFYYWVRAVNDNYKGSFSDYAYGTIADGAVVELKKARAKRGISGALGSMRTYRINVPAGQAVLEVLVSGGKGDCDINVSIGENGSRRYSLRSSTIENIQYENPEAGYYYINIYGKTAYSGVTLLARYTDAVPPKPSALIASNGRFADKIVLTWKASSCATSYDIFRALKIGKTMPPMPDEPIATVADTEYEDTDVLFGEIYCYWLKAHNPMGFSKVTAAVTGNLMQAPTAPGTVTASDWSYFDKIRVTWAKMANVTNYEVYRTTDKTFVGDTLVGTVEASNLLSYVLDDFTVPANSSPATLYYYWVKGINKINERATLSKSDSGYVSNKGPATATATKGTVFEKVRLSWALIAGATSYEVWKDDSFLVNVGASPYEDNLDPLDNTLHKYKVQAKYVNGDIGYLSAFSPVASGYAADAPITLAAPILKSVSTNLYTYVLISWSEVAKAQKYRLYRSETNVFSKDNWIADVEGLTYSDEVKPGGIEVGVKYYYWVTAVNGDGLGAAVSRPSASKSGMAAAAVNASFGDPKKHPYGQEITVAGAGNGSAKYYSIVVPADTTRLMATLSGKNTRRDDCHVYAKLGCYPTSSSYNAKGADTKTDEVLTVSNPAEGTWYFMLYGAGIDGYTERDLTIACYSAADIYLTTVPVNDLNVPLAVTFKGKVVDKAGTGIPGLSLMARNPITGLCSYLGAKTDAAGKFSYSDVISIEGEHTFDFFFDTMPDIAKGTASHTVFTKNTSLNTSVFDFSAYLNASLVGLNETDILGMQEFLNTSNGWDDEPISESYQSIWIENTIGKVQGDKALLGKLAGGLYLFLYGVEGAGAGNNTAINAGAYGAIPISGLSAVPFIVHVDEADKANVLANIFSLGIVDDTTNAEIAAGKVGVVVIAAFDATGKTNNISLSACEQLNLLLNIANKDASVLFLEDGKYSNVLTKKFEVSVGNERAVKVITSSFVPNTTTITEE